MCVDPYELQLVIVLYTQVVTEYRSSFMGMVAMIQHENTRYGIFAVFSLPKALVLD